MPVIEFNINGVRKTILFSFVPKTGGTSVLKFFKDLGARIHFDEAHNSIVGPLRCPAQHLHYEHLDALFDIDRFDFSFSIVRNPIDRSFSDYKWAYRRAETSTGIPPFEKWVSLMLDAYVSNNYVFDNHIRPQRDFVGPKISKIYKYELGLEQILADVMLSSGLKMQGLYPNVPHENAGSQNAIVSRVARSEFLSDRIRYLHNDFYKDDFNSFSY